MAEEAGCGAGDCEVGAWWTLVADGEGCLGVVAAAAAGVGVDTAGLRLNETRGRGEAATGETAIVSLAGGDIDFAGARAVGCCEGRREWADGFAFSVGLGC